MGFFSRADVACREAVIYRVVVECRVEVSLNKETKFTLPYSLSRSLSLALCELAGVYCARCRLTGGVVLLKGGVWSRLFSTSANYLSGIAGC